MAHSESDAEEFIFVGEAIVCTWVQLVKMHLVVGSFLLKAKLNESRLILHHVYLEVCTHELRSIGIELLVEDYRFLLDH